VLSALKELDLQSCSSLATLPASIGQLAALQRLHLLCCSSLQALPDTI
jgi:hypothetical protein